MTAKIQNYSQLNNFFAEKARQADSTAIMFNTDYQAL